jgi:CheY-like chemotaxis protein
VEILIIEDDPDVGLLILDVLASRGMKTTLVPHPSAIPRDLGAAVVVSDLFGPPWFDRARAAAHVAELRERFPATPIVLLTAFAEAARDHPHIGADAIVTKPFDIDALSRTVLSLARAEAREVQLVVEEA